MFNFDFLHLTVPMYAWYSSEFVAFTLHYSILHSIWRPFWAFRITVQGMAFVSICRILAASYMALMFCRILMIPPYMALTCRIVASAVSMISAVLQLLSILHNVPE